MVPRDTGRVLEPAIVFGAGDCARRCVVNARPVPQQAVLKTIRTFAEIMQQADQFAIVPCPEGLRERAA